MTGRDEPSDEQRRRDQAALVEADGRMLEFLRRDDFSGGYYEEWQHTLVSTVVGRLIRNVQNASVFSDPRAGGFVWPSTKERLILARDENEATSLAGRMIAASLKSFREVELVGGGWVTTGGATIAQYYYGAAVQRLPQAYRAWQRTQRHLGRLSADQMRLIFRMEAADAPTSSIVAAVGLPEDVVSRVLRGDLAAGGEFSAPDNWEFENRPHLDPDHLEHTQEFERLLSLIREEYREVAVLLQHGYRPVEIGMKLGIPARRVTKIKQQIMSSLEKAGYGKGYKTAEGGDAR